jgi:iron complex transport system substrate-binding protein
MICRWIVLFAVFGFALSSPARADLWQDALGRDVEVPEAPRRIVSLAPSVTEILFALRLGDRVAGVTRFCTYPEEARSKPQVGGYADPSLEAVAALEPDLVFTTAATASPGLLSRLGILGIPVYVIDFSSFEGTVAAIREMGRVAGASEAGECLAGDLAAVSERIRKAASGRKKPRVLFCVMVRPLVVAGPRTIANDLIDIAGGKNLAPPAVTPYPTWSAEALLAADPDVIVVSPHPGDPDPAEFFNRWPELRAVRNGRIVMLESDWVHRPGPRLAFGLAAMAQAFHGLEISMEEESWPK